MWRSLCLGWCGDLQLGRFGVERVRYGDGWFYSCCGLRPLCAQTQTINFIDPIGSGVSSQVLTSIDGTTLFTGLAIDDSGSSFGFYTTLDTATGIWSVGSGPGLSDFVPVLDSGLSVAPDGTVSGGSVTSSSAGTGFGGGGSGAGGGGLSVDVGSAATGSKLTASATSMGSQLGVIFGVFLGFVIFGVLWAWSRKGVGGDGGWG